MEITRVTVVGAGTMGSGITQVIAQAGVPVTMIDREEQFVERGMATIARNLQRAVERGRMSQEDADVAEVLSIKTDVFRRLDQVCEPTAILASNTSSIPITQLGAVTNRPDQVVGMHFFNPVPVMQLVEIVRGLRTSDETTTSVTEFARRLGKTPVTVKDSPGFVSNRVLMPMINEAIFCLYEGVASKEDIDTVMRLGMNHPMGPLALADLIGLDVCLDILEVLHRDFGDPKYRPCPLLRTMVSGGKLGRKSGEGFYTYDER